MLKSVSNSGILAKSTADVETAILGGSMGAVLVGLAAAGALATETSSPWWALAGGVGGALGGAAIGISIGALI